MSQNSINSKVQPVAAHETLIVMERMYGRNFNWSSILDYLGGTVAVMKWEYKNENGRQFPAHMNLCAV